MHVDGFEYKSKYNFHPGNKRIFEHPDLHVCGQFLPRAICKDVPDQDPLLQRSKRVSKVKTYKIKLVDGYIIHRQNTRENGSGNIELSPMMKKRQTDE